MILFLILAICFLAYSNGANDNFKGVASLYGSRTLGYKSALIWATITTAAGSLAALFLAQTLLMKFSGKGWVADGLISQPGFLLAVALGAGGTVILATVLGFPISTTHGLIGALVGAGLVSGINNVNLTALGTGFLLPLLLSPALALVAGAIIYLIFRGFRLSTGIRKEICLCLGREVQIIPINQPHGLFAMESIPILSFTADSSAACHQRYTGSFLGINTRTIVDALHFLSAGAVSFARGLNDTPKIAGLLLLATALPAKWAMVAVGLGMATGGWVNSRKVAETMSKKITGMNTGQGLAANLATALLVNTASYHGLPVSTTHVSVGSLLGIGITTRQVKWKPVLGILMSWVVTLPCAALLAAITFWLFRILGKT